MPATKRQIEFSTLRKAYVEVKQFLEKESFAEVENLEARLEVDLGMAGDDNYGLLEKFVKRYQLDTSGFDYSRHFISEGELFGSDAVAFKLFILLPAYTIAWLVRLLSFGKLNWVKEVKAFAQHPPTLDLSFGDLLTWYLTGCYNLRKDIRFQLSK